MAKKRKLSKIGLQLYTVRRELEKDFEGTLAKVAALGFSEVEFAGYFNRTPQQVKSILAKHNLAAPSVHVLPAVLRSSLQQTIDAAKTIGHQYVVCAYLLPEERKTLDDYKRLVDLFNDAGTLPARSRQRHGCHAETLLHRSRARHDKFQRDFCRL